MIDSTSWVTVVFHKKWHLDLTCSKCLL